MTVQKQEFTLVENALKGIAVPKSANHANMPGQLFFCVEYTRWFAIFAASVGLAAQVGCQKDQDSDSASMTGHDSVEISGPSGTEIMDQVRQSYRTADCYRDDATLHISYQLLGSFLEEPHPWQVRFLRNRGLSMDTFQARIRADDQQLGCFVFDFGSGNLDNQWQVHPILDSLPFRPLFQDGICRHYLTGREELPVNTENKDAADVFFPPTIGLLTGQMIPEWLAEGKAKRLADEKTEGRSCYHVQMTYSKMQWNLLIDYESFVVRQIQYPGELLDQRLQHNPDVKHLEITAKFKDATLLGQLNPADFRVSPPAKAKRVSRFVAVPEPFPSSNIGKPVSSSGFRDALDQAANQKDWIGKVTLLCWTNQCENEQDMINILDELATNLPSEQNLIARVEVINGTLPGNPQVKERLGRLASDSVSQILADYGFSAGRALGIDHYPSFALVDTRGVLQYVGSLLDKPVSVEELSELIQRVRSGDDIAGEMRREYEAFLDLYQERLAVAMQQAGSGRDDGRLAASSHPTHLRVRHSWTNDEFLQPGNLKFHSNESGNPITVLDGWRTVIQIDASGREQDRKELDLDSQESISIVRSGDKQKTLRVLYSVMGRTVWVLDEQLHTLHTIEVHNDQQRIRDANLVDFDNDDQDELMVSFTGPRGTEIIELGNSNSNRRISTLSFRSSTIIRRNDGRNSLVFCDEKARLRHMDSGAETVTDVDCDLVATIQVVSRKDARGNTMLCALGTNQQGTWTAIGIDEDMNQIWSVAIGSQRFETQIDSIAYAHLPGSRAGLWAIAAVDGSIRLIGDDGKLVDNWNCGFPIHGIELVAKGNEYLLLVSTDHNVQGWAVSAGTEKFVPASSSN